MVTNASSSGESAKLRYCVATTTAVRWVDGPTCLSAQTYQRGTWRRAGIIAADYIYSAPQPSGYLTFLRNCIPRRFMTANDAVLAWSAPAITESICGERKACVIAVQDILTPRPSPQYSGSST